MVMQLHKIKKLLCNDSQQYNLLPTRIHYYLLGLLVIVCRLALYNATLLGVGGTACGHVVNHLNP